MFSNLRRVSRATLVSVTSLIAALLLPATARAIHVRWSNGSTNLTATQATQAVLVVQADSAEGTLPNGWRLQWTADSLGVQFSAFSSSAGCGADTARADQVTPPQSAADSAANEVTARFCSTGSHNATTALFLVDVPAGGHGKLKVVALDANDTTQVIESNEVSYNGGVQGAFGPTLASLEVSHPSSALTITARGRDLADVTSVSLGAPNHAWRIPLTIRSQSESTLVAGADFPAPLSASVLAATGRAGAVGAAPVAAETIVGVATSVLPLSVHFSDPDSLLGVFPKDFAFTYSYLPNPWRLMFHLYYIRAFNSSDTTGVVLAHAWSNDLVNWSVNRAAFQPRAKWDCRHIWAPSIVAKGDSVYMFYAAVGFDGNQSIGYAARHVLDDTDGDGTVWVRDSSAILRLGMLAWADQASGASLRDPFVTEYPAGSGQFLMLYVAQNPLAAGDKEVVGLSLNPSGNLRTWSGHTYFGSTAVEDNSWGVTRIEAPVAFRDPSNSLGWCLMYSDGGQGGSQKYLRLERAATTSALTDTSRVNWSIIGNLYSYLGNPNGQYVLGWQGSEHFRLGGFDFFAAWDPSGINISRMQWSGGQFSLNGNVMAAVDRTPAEAGFRVVGSIVSSSAFRFGLSSIGGERVTVEVLDVGGRLVRRVISGTIAPGHAILTWNCNDRTDAKVRPGVYLARCRRASRSETVKLVVAY